MCSITVSVPGSLEWASLPSTRTMDLAQWSAFINAINYICISWFDVENDTISSALYSKWGEATATVCANCGQEWTISPSVARFSWVWCFKTVIWQSECEGNKTKQETAPEVWYTVLLFIFLSLCYSFLEHFIPLKDRNEKRERWDKEEM